MRHRVRSIARRVPGARQLYDGLVRGRRELTALGYGLRGAARKRRGLGAGEASSGQRVFECALVPGFPDSLAEIGDFVVSQGLRHERCTVGLYLPPQPGLERLFGDIVDLYPADAAYELVLAATKASPGSAASRGVPDDMMLAANVLHARGLGPRVYDRVEFVRGRTRVTVVVMQHTGDARADDAGRAAVIEGLNVMIRAGEIVPLRPDWRAPDRFRCTDGNGPSILGTRRFLHCGLDSFRVPQQADLVQRVLDEARPDLHFGLELVLRGGRYLYQSVPTVGAGGRRDSSKRWSYFSALLRETETDISGRVVLDVGCNAGMMLSAALAGGASWGLGWDRPSVAHRARELLLALGYTRFDVFSAELDEQYGLVEDVPTHLRTRLDGSIVLYLAIRHHVGFLRDLATFPWRALVYEGGEMETRESVGRTLAVLRESCDFEIGHLAEFRDSETGARPVAILLRSAQPSLAGG